VLSSFDLQITRIMKNFTGVTLALLWASCQAIVVHHASKALRFAAPLAEREEVVQPLKFDQQLLVCNAYPGSFGSESTVSVTQNGRDAHDILYKECRRIAGHVHSKDKLDFNFTKSGIRGTFEIGTLPDTDATLLLVVQKRDATSQLAAFQSFVFPAKQDGKEAQLAVIDTYKGASPAAHLRMEDHVNGKEKKTVSKRVEQLNFNRIYAIEEGAYDASISDHLEGESAEQMVEQTKRVLRLSKNQNYVVLRTGDGKLGGSSESLVIFPNEEHSSALRATTVSFALVALLARLLW